MKIKVILLLAVISLVSGCTNIKVKKEAFIKPNKVAVVYSGGYIDWRWSGTQADNQRLLRDSTEIVLKELNKSSHLKIVNQNSVFANSHYRDMKDITPKKDAYYLTTPGYKAFDPKKDGAKLKALAKTLNADGLLTIYMEFTISKGMGNDVPVLNLFVYATDPNGVVIWQDIANHGGKDFMTLAQVCTREIIDNLDKQLRAK